MNSQPLPKWEANLCFAGYLLMLYPVYCLYQLSSGTGNSNKCHIIIVRSRNQLNLKIAEIEIKGTESNWYPYKRVDESDFEWSVFTSLVLKTLPWSIVHLLGSQFIRKCTKSVKVSSCVRLLESPTYFLGLTVYYSSNSIKCSQPIPIPFESFGGF